MSESKSKSFTLLLYLIVIIATIVFIFPIAWMFLTSLKSQNDAFTAIPKWIFTVTYDNYQTVLFERDFQKYLWNSLYVSVFSTVLAVILGSGIATRSQGITSREPKTS